MHTLTNCSWWRHQMEIHDDVIKWKHFPRNWPFVRGIPRSPVNSPHKGQWRGALMFSLICTWINGWVNNGEAGDLRRFRVHYDVTVMIFCVTNPLCGEFTGHRCLMCTWINGCVNNREAGELGCHRAHYDVIVMFPDNGYSNSDRFTHWGQDKMTAILQTFSNTYFKFDKHTV